MVSDIKQQFDKVISYSQDNIDNPKTDRLFKLWEENKAHIIQAFGDKLIYELPEKVAFELSDEAKKDRINNFMFHLHSLGYPELACFIESEREGFYKNKVMKNFIVADGKNTTITKNTKLVKAFKHFVHDPDRLHTLQDMASQIIQENKIEGKLCFSVHPLDYLSISENTYNWRSCHALDGEYRAGNLSYMMDKATIVCYLKGDDEVKLPNFPDDVLWNNKKWRVLLYLSNDWRMMFAGKQYPFSTEGGMKAVLEFFNEHFNKAPFDTWYNAPSATAYWSEWTDEMIGYETEIGGISFDFGKQYIPLNDGLLSLGSLMKDADGSKHFNDVLKSSCYEPMRSYLVYDEKYWDNKTSTYASRSTRFSIGEMTYCMRCGKEEAMDGSSTMMCYDCELNYGTAENDSFCFCNCCGRRIPTEDVYWIGDDNYCPSCYDTHAARCDNCGESYLIEDMIYNEIEDTYTCTWCFNNC